MLGQIDRRARPLVTCGLALALSLIILASCQQADNLLKPNPAPSTVTVVDQAQETALVGTYDAWTYTSATGWLKVSGNQFVIASDRLTMAGSSVFPSAGFSSQKLGFQSGQIWLVGASSGSSQSSTVYLYDYVVQDAQTWGTSILWLKPDSSAALTLTTPPDAGMATAIGILCFIPLGKVPGSVPPLPVNAVAKPTFTPAGGVQTNNFFVTLATATAGASIRYTLDGSDPSPTVGTLYTSPVPVTTTTTMKAIAFKTGLTTSDVVSETYTIPPVNPVQVTFEPNGGSALTALNTSKIETVPVSILAGKALVGWYSDPSFSSSSKISFPYLPSTDTTLYARWTPSTVGLQFSASATGYTVNPGSFTGGDLLIPAFWLGKPVTAIGSFYAMRDIASVSIPASVTSIENYAFTYCPVGVSVDPASSSFKAVEGVLFDKAGTTLVYFPGHTTAAYIIPAGVTTIAQGAFMTADVPAITFPSSLTTINDQAFFECSNLKNLILPTSLTSVGFEAFRGCRNLTWIQVDSVSPPMAKTGLFFQSGKFTTIRVPDASVTAYQAAAGWSDYATLVTAKSTPTTFVVGFQSNGGSTVPALNGVTNGTKLSKPTDPTKSGNTFAGWYKDPGLTNIWNFTTDTVTTDVLLYAKWTASPGTGGIVVTNPDSLKVTLSGQTDLLDFGTSLTVTATPSSSVDGYAWYLDGILVPTQSTASFSTATTLLAGPHSLMVTVKRGGNLASTTCYFSVQ